MKKLVLFLSIIIIPTLAFSQGGMVFDQAIDILFTPAGNISSSDVQSAIEELDSEKQTDLGYTPVDAADWTTHNNYPDACSAGQAVTGLGDTLSCAPFWDALIDMTLADGSIYIGDASNNPVAQAVTGDITITNGGVTSIGAAKVKDTMLDTGTGAGQISASDMPDEDIGDITISSGVYTVNAGSIHDLTINVKEENTSAIVKGQAVYVSGSAGAGQVLVGLIDNTVSTKIRTLGLAAEAISQNTTGTVRFRGELSGIDTLGTNAVNPNGETWAAGDILYCTNGGSSGGLTNIRPTSGRIIRAGYSLIGSHNSDTILVQPHENPICLATASGEDICVRMGDNDGVNKTCFRDYANNIVACVDSNGIFTSAGLTIGSAAILEAELEILDGATLTTTELNYVDGVTSAIQTQIDAKAPLASPALTGDPTATTPAADDNDTSVATTAWSETTQDYLKTSEWVAASKTVAGKIEIATTAEIDTGSDSTRAIPVDQFVASKRNIRWLVFNLVEADTATATATNIAGDFVSPIAGTILQSDTTPFYLYATNSTAGVTDTMTTDISIEGTSIMITNKLDFDTGEKTTTTAATPPDLTTTTLAVGDIITIDIDAVHTTPASGLIVYMAIRE